MLYKGDTLYLDWLEDGIAELVFDAPGSVNKLDTATVASLGEAIGVLEQQSDLKGLLLRSNKAAFIVGADITEFLSLFLVIKLSSKPVIKPVVVKEFGGAVVQSVRIPACHAGGRGFESRPFRHYSLMKMSSESRKIFNFAVFLYLNSTISLFNDFTLA